MCSSSPPPQRNYIPAAWAHEFVNVHAGAEGGETGDMGNLGAKHIGRQLAPTTMSVAWDMLERPCREEIGYGAGACVCEQTCMSGTVSSV